MEEKPRLIDYLDKVTLDFKVSDFLSHKFAYEQRFPQCESTQIDVPESIRKRRVFPKKNPMESQWWINYVVDPNSTFRDERHRDGKLFRRRFTVPFELKNILVTKAKEWYHPGPDAIGRQPSPIELLVLSVLRILGRRWTFDDCSEATFISEEVIRNFFHLFVEKYATVVFPNVCRPPTTEAEIAACMAPYAQAGFDGCIQSVDVTHIKWWKCSYNLKQLHTGKYGYATRAYEVSVCRRRCVSATRGSFGSYNDKTIIRFDKHIQSIFNKTLFQDIEYKLFDEHGNESIHKGAWSLCDNGYHLWRILQCPIKFPINTETQLQSLWSEWAESLRKDVECFFGILKTRFEILNSGVRCQSESAVDNIFLTCCALHNELLDFDADDDWSLGAIPQRLQRTAGEECDDDNDDLPNVIRRTQLAAQDIDISNDHIQQNDSNEFVDESITRDESEEHFEFREKLIKHWTYRWKTQSISWPN